MPSVYIETSIPSVYYETRKTPQAIAWRQATRQWWDRQGANYELVTSSSVILEASAAPDRKARAMVRMLSDLHQLPFDARIQEIAEYYIRHRVMPSDAQGDASHLAYASFHAIDYLLTWNCRHLANANKERHIEVANARLGLSVPRLVTPLNLMEFQP